MLDLLLNTVNSNERQNSKRGDSFGNMDARIMNLVTYDVGDEKEQTVEV
jgi:hypothetical protein